jgi:hypothetical protein
VSQGPIVAEKIPVVRDGLLYGADSDVAAWVGEKLGCGITLIPMQAIGIIAADVPNGPAPPTPELRHKIIAGAIFWGLNRGIIGSDPVTNEEFTWNKMAVSAACDNVAAAHPELLARMLDYPFGDENCDLLTAEIALSNTNALRQAKKLGFRQVGIMDSPRPGGEMAFLTMRRDQCDIWQKYKPEPEQKAA